MRVIFYILVMCTVILDVTACSGVSLKRDSAPSGYNTFTSTDYGIRIAYPRDLELRHTFKRSYLGADGWKTYLGPNSASGHAVAALVLPRSNNITAGELRIGVSRQSKALRHCTTPPNAVRPGSVGHTEISGVAFETFEAADAAMSHYLDVRSYRAVHDRTCYAIDVLVFGTNPQVYDPPAIPPFTKAEAFARLTPVVRQLQFIDTVPSAPFAQLPATYRGLLPCADCPGIDYQLDLMDGGRYALRMIYRDRNSSFDETGRWHVSDDGRTLFLESNDGGRGRWQVLESGKRLRLLDAHGNPIHANLNFDLTRTLRFQPIDRNNPVDRH